MYGATAQRPADTIGMKNTGGKLKAHRQMQVERKKVKMPSKARPMLWQMKVGLATPQEKRTPRGRFFRSHAFLRETFFTMSESKRAKSVSIMQMTKKTITGSSSRKLLRQNAQIAAKVTLAGIIKNPLKKNVLMRLDSAESA